MTEQDLIKGLRDIAEKQPLLLSDPPQKNQVSSLMSRAADALEAYQWRDMQGFDALPQPSEREIVRGIKGKKHSSMEFVPNWFWVQTKCGQVMQSYVMKSGRLHGLATGEMPVAWMPNPLPQPYKEKE